MDFWKKIVLSFLRAFVASLVITVPGVLASPNFDTAKALGISALIGGVAAGIRAIQHLFVDTTPST